jgi:sulfatase-like protein
VKQTPIYPFLIAAFPVLSLWSANVQHVELVDVAAALLVTSLLAAVALRAVGIVVGNRDCAAAVASIWLLVFLSYGHLARACESLHVGPIALSHLPYVTAIAAAIGLSATLGVRAIRGRAQVLTRTLTLVGGALIAITVVEVAASASLTAVGHADYRATAGERSSAAAPGGALPDVYYVVLDGYASLETLRDVYRFDNTPFYDELRRDGFTIAGASRSNYPMTALSLASSLNMRYLDEELREAPTAAGAAALLGESIRDNEVLRTFRSHGYRIVHLDSGWDATDRNRFADVNVACGFLSDYTTALIKSTFAAPLDRFVHLTDHVHARRVSCELAQLADAADRARPSFVFAHVLAPHPPFVFGPRGEWLPEPAMTPSADVNQWADRARYVDEIRAVNERLRAAVRRILERRDRPAVVILQGDHGPASIDQWERPDATFLRERLTIFNAYLVPRDVRDRLYPSITPVNSFRALFSAYFGADLPRLPDRTYFSTYAAPLALVDVTDRLTRADDDRYHSVSAAPAR